MSDLLAIIEVFVQSSLGVTFGIIAIDFENSLWVAVEVTAADIVFAF